MTLNLIESIGRLLVVGIPGTELDRDTRKVLEDLHVGAVILFRRNLETPDQIAALTADLHSLESQPLVAIDQEGGRVRRLGEPFMQIPPAASVGRAADAELAYRVGLAIGEELAAVGIDVDFAPVFDVHSNAENPVIGDRAYGSSPQLVADMAIAVMCGLVAGGVIPCGKHFPGHGDTAVDSHVEMPIVRRKREQLEQIELAPFRAAVAAGIPMLMASHVLYPALDQERPASLSKTILTDLLRGELRFEGLVATDDMEMGAITGRWDIAEAAVAAVAGGAEWLLICESLDNACRVRDGLADACSRGLFVQHRLAEVEARLQRLREFRRGVSPPPCPLPSASHRALLRDLERRGV